jgi:hypothetical protein
MIGYSSYKFFVANGFKSKADLLLKGIIYYWCAAVAILISTRSFSFLFWIYIEPLLCMSYFLALINVGFHGFIEFDENNKNIAYINSTTIIEGEDDLFGEDDHMAHHYYPNIYFKNLKTHQLSKIEDFKKCKASVFKKLSIVELSIFILFGLWDKLVDHYVDFSGELTRDEIKEMLQRRAKTLETSFEKYEKYLENPTPENRKIAIASTK